MEPKQVTEIFLKIQPIRITLWPSNVREKLPLGFFLEIDDPASNLIVLTAFISSADNLANCKEANYEFLHHC